MVRLASYSDLPRLVELARREHAGSPWAGIPFDAAHTEQSMDSFVTGFGRTLLCSEGGYLLGFVQPLGFSKKLVALEYAWFSVDGTGLAMLRRFQEWAKSMNAVSVIVHDYAGDGRLGSVLTRHGWQSVGAALSLSLED